MDLSEAFGRPATTSLRGLLPRRGDDAGANGSVPAPSATEPSAPASSAAAPSAPEPSDTAPSATATPDAAGAPVDVLAPRSPGRTGRTGSSTEHAATARRTATNRRWGVARVASRDHVDLLVLLALRHGPTDGRGVITRLRETSGGRLDAPERTVHTTLHRLARNRLLARSAGHDSGRHLYSLTPAGERAARSRLREWHALTRCMDAVAASDATS